MEKDKQVSYYLSGIATELIVSSILLLIPFTSLVGALFILNISLNFLTGVYGYEGASFGDITQAAEINPSFSFLLSPLFKISFLLISIALIYVSYKYQKLSYKKFKKLLI